MAHERLAAVQDAGAIPALELVFCGDTEPMALVGVNKFAEMTVADASLALARQALFSPWPAVRKAAVEKLKTRDRETYVPELLSAMASPTQSRMELFQEPDGRLLYRHAFYRPGQDRDELVVLDTMYDSSFAVPLRLRRPAICDFRRRGPCDAATELEGCGRSVRSRAYDRVMAQVLTHRSNTLSLPESGISARPIPPRRRPKADASPGQRRRNGPSPRNGRRPPKHPDHRRE